MTNRTSLINLAQIQPEENTRRTSLSNLHKNIREKTSSANDSGNAFSVRSEIYVQLYTRSSNKTRNQKRVVCHLKNVPLKHNIITLSKLAFILVLRG